MLSESMGKLSKTLVDLHTKQPTFVNNKQVFEVNKLISKAATFYEKVRYLVDYQEEHTIRRNAIERILKRKVIIEGGEVSGLALLQELASGQYIEEAQVTEELGLEIDKVLGKYSKLQSFKEIANATRKTLISFTATEIDHLLSHLHYAKDQAIVDAFYDMTRKNIILPGMHEKEADLQLYCACHRALFRADEEALSYALWLKYVPAWKNIREEEMPVVAEHLQTVLHGIEITHKNSIQWRLVQKLKNETVYFLIVRELVQQNGADSGHILENPGELEIYTKSLLEKKYTKENQRIRSSGVRAVIYLFFTKIIFALALEVPYEIIYIGSINYFPLTVNILFHPLLLLIATRGVGSFDEKNTKAVVTGMQEMFYHGNSTKIKIRTANTGLTYVFGAVYLVLIGTVFSAIIVGLRAMQFNIVGGAIFLFFLALVSYFAFRIRYNAKRWKVTQRETAVSLLVSIFTMPVIRTGRWLSQSFSTINVFVLIMDFIIETPFKFILNFSNQFISYLKEKTPEVY